MLAKELINKVEAALPDSAYLRPGGSLLVMVGLPGAGKSYIVEKLRELIPFGVVTTDLVRLQVRDQPTYTAAEVAYIYEICYGVINRRLEQGKRVVFDGSNYLAARRERLFEIGRRQRAAIAMGYVQASAAVTRERLAARMMGKRRAGDWSDAGWSVYQWMVEAQEPLAYEHVTLDTTVTPPEELAHKLCNYWREQEKKGVDSSFYKRNGEMFKR